MSDLVLTCSNCKNQFVFSEGERAFFAAHGLEDPKLCPICRAMKKQETIRPPKPTADQAQP